MRKIEKDGSAIYPVMVPAGDDLQTYNFYIVEFRHSLILIDAGIDDDACWESFQQTLAANGFSIRDVSEVILTHHHPDHVGLVNRILAQHNIPVYAHERSVPYLKRDEKFLNMRIRFFARLYREMDCGAAGARQIENMKQALQQKRWPALASDIRTLREGSGLLHLLVKEVPGHAPDHVAFYDAARKWLFAGDHLIAHLSSNAIVEPDHEGNRIRTLTEYVRSLQRCLSWDIETVFPGHGDLILDPALLIRNRIARIEQKSQKVLAMIQNGISTGSRLAQTWYKDKYENQFFWVMSEVVGLLDYLESQNKIGKRLVDGVCHYFAC